ncbi:hypothetical protein BDZ94DRAFT_1241355, partial [Collybia nuda]
HRDWFKRWPEPGTESLSLVGITDKEKTELGKRIDERKRKIKQWFNNHGNKTRKAKPIVLRVNAKTRRRPQLLEFYSHKVYDSKVKKMVDEEMEEKQILPKGRLAVARRITLELFEKEPEDIKKDILAEYEAVSPPTIKTPEGGESCCVTVKSMAEYVIPFFFVVL